MVVTGPDSLDQPSAIDEATARLDAAVLALMRVAAPISFRIASSETERRAAYRLRYEAVISQGWGTPDQFPGGIECELLDERALHMVAWLDSEAVANCRVLLPIPGEPLPMETEYGITVEPENQVVQIDRICLGNVDRVRYRPMLLSLMAATWIEVRRQGFTVCAGLNTESMLRVYRSIGFEHEVLGAAQRSWSEDRYPVRFSPLNVTERFYELVTRTVMQDS